MRKELKPSEWVQEINQGLEFRRQFGLEQEWQNLEVLFYNLAGSGLGPNLISSTGDSLLSSLTVPFPSVTVTALREEYIPSARIVQAVDTYLMRELAIPIQVELAALHAFLWGRGIVKLGFDSEFGFDPSLDIGLGSPLGPLGTSVSQFDRRGDMIESGIARPGMPWALSCLPHDIVVPWGTREIADAPWIAHRVVRHIEDIRADPKYSHAKTIEPNLSMKDFVSSYKTVMKPYRVGVYPSVSDKFEYVEVWEVHDRRTRQVLAIPIAGERFLRKDPDVLQIDGLPFVSFAFVPIARNFWTTSDAFYLKQPQGELDDISMQASKQRRISVAKLLASVDAMDAAEIDKLTSADVGAVVMVKSGFNPKDAVTTFQNPPNVFLANDADFVRRNARESVGLSRNQMGEFEQRGRRTAFEVAKVDEYSARRMGRRQVTMKRVYEEIFRKLNQIVFEFWKTYRVVEVVGPAGKEWVKFTGDQIKGEYAYDVTFSEEPPIAQASPRSDALQLYTALSQDPTVDQVALRDFVTKAFSDPSITRIFEGGGPNAGVGLQVPKMPAGGGKIPS